MRKISNPMLLMMMFCVLLGSSVTGCGSSKFNTAVSTDYSYKNEMAEYGLQDNGAAEEMAEYDIADAEVYESSSAAGNVADSSGIQTNSEQNSSNQKIIKKYYYHYETETFDDAYQYLREQIEKYQGYISSSEVEGSGYRTLYLTARIPAAASDEFTGQMGNLGTVVRQSESAEDVTLQYTDTESRIASLKTEQERLNELLKKADSLDTIIALEERLTEVRYELENYQSQKKLYDNLIDYSTVDITLQEVNYTVPVDDSTFISRISTGLQGSLRDIKEESVDLLVWFIVSLPYLLIWGIVVVIIVLVIRKIRKRRRERKRMSAKQKEDSQKQHDESVQKDKKD